MNTFRIQSHTDLILAFVAKPWWFPPWWNLAMGHNQTQKYQRIPQRSLTLSLRLPHCARLRWSWCCFASNSDRKKNKNWSCVGYRWQPPLVCFGWGLSHSPQFYPNHYQTLSEACGPDLPQKYKLFVLLALSCPLDVTSQFHTWWS